MMIAALYVGIGVILIVLGVRTRQFYTREFGFHGERREANLWGGRLFFIGSGILALGSGVYSLIKLLRKA